MMLLFPIIQKPETEESRECPWESPVLATPPSIKVHDKFIRKATNIDSGRPILVGREYQATVPDYIGGCPSGEYRSDCELLCWSFEGFRTQSVPEDFLGEYSRLAKLKHSFEIDQSFQFLHAYDYNIAEAFNHMSKFYAVQGYKWNKDDKRTFRVAYQFFGKDFASIRNLLKHKSFPEIVEYYYIIYKRKRYIINELIAWPDGLSEDKPEFKSPVAETAEELVRKAKKSAMVKVQTCGPKCKMRSLRKKQGRNDLCTFNKAQLRELNKPHNHPLKIREKIESLKIELRELCTLNEKLRSDLPK